MDKLDTAEDNFFTAQDMEHQGDDPETKLCERCQQHTITDEMYLVLGDWVCLSCMED